MSLERVFIYNIMKDLLSDRENSWYNPNGRKKKDTAHRALRGQGFLMIIRHEYERWLNFIVWFVDNFAVVVEMNKIWGNLSFWFSNDGSRFASPFTGSGIVKHLVAMTMGQIFPCRRKAPSRLSVELVKMWFIETKNINDYPERWITWLVGRWRTQLIARQLVNCRTHEHRHFERTLRSTDTIPGPRLAEGRFSYNKLLIASEQNERSSRVYWARCNGVLITLGVVWNETSSGENIQTYSPEKD